MPFVLYLSNANSTYFCHVHCTYFCDVHIHAKYIYSCQVHLCAMYIFISSTPSSQVHIWQPAAGRMGECTTHDCFQGTGMAETATQPAMSDN